MHMPFFAPLLIILVVWIGPLCAGIWALVTLARISRQQGEILARLSRLEQGPAPAALRNS